MENDYRITKLHGTLIGDNRIPDLPAGEKTKVFSSTNGKTAWVDLPTDVGKDANGFAVLCHDGVEITGQSKTVKLADVRENGAVIGRDQTASAPQTDELITKAYADKSYGRLGESNTWTRANTFDFETTFNDEVRTKSGISNLDRTDLVFTGEDISQLGFNFKRVTGFVSTYSIGTIDDPQSIPGFEGVVVASTEASLNSVPVLTHFSATGKFRWFNYTSSAQYDYQLPKKSGTIALTSDLSEAGTSVTIRRW